MLKRPLDHFIYTTHPLQYHTSLSIVRACILAYMVHYKPTGTCGVSALQVQTLVLYSEANARVIPLEAYALLFRATRDVSSLIVPRSWLLSLDCSPMGSCSHVRIRDGV